MKRLLTAIGLLGLIVSVALAQNSPWAPTISTAAPPGATWLQSGISANQATYKYSSLGNTPAATPTDVVTLAGSATAVVRVSKIIVGGLATTVGQLNPLIVRRSAVDTTGTSTNPTIMKRDINDVAATAVLALYTANPGGLGTTVGTLDSCRLFLNLASGAGSANPDVCAFTYGINNDRPLVLRGVTDIVAINFAGAAVPTGGLLDFDIEWTEAPQ